MKTNWSRLSLLGLSLLLAVQVSAQQVSTSLLSRVKAQAEAATASARPAQTTQGQVVPHLIKFSGVVGEADGEPRTGVTGITFALYKDEEGGAALWLETQNVTLDQQGRYTVLLGVTKSEGLPLELFTANEARWLGVEPEGQPEQPRVLLVSVPYALKAADAETLGGKPASAFVLSAAGAHVKSGTVTPSCSGTCNSGTVQSLTSAAANYVVKFSGDNITLGNSLLFDNGTNLGIGTTSPGNKLDVVGSGDLQVAAFESSAAGNSGISIKNPSQNWVLGVRGDLSQAFNVRNITSNKDILLVSTSGDFRFNGGVDATGTAIKHARSSGSCTTGSNQGNTCTITCV